MRGDSDNLASNFMDYVRLACIWIGLAYIMCPFDQNLLISNQLSGIVACRLGVEKPQTESPEPQGNMDRDRRVLARLRREGWSVLRFWEHDIMGNPDKCVKRFRRKMRAKASNQINPRYRPR